MNLKKQKLTMKACGLLWMLAISGCASMQPVQVQCKQKPPQATPAPAPWLMVPAPNSLLTLEQLISVSETKSQEVKSK